MPLLQVTREVLTLVPEPVGRRGGHRRCWPWLDADAFARAASAALAGHNLDACRAALALYTGEYLPDDRGERWADGPRRRLAGLHHRLLLRASDLSAARGESVVAEEYLLALLAADPAHEEAAARLMALLAGQGRRSEALRTYDAWPRRWRRTSMLCRARAWKRSAPGWWPRLRRHRWPRARPRHRRRIAPPTCPPR